ncbi:GGDEF domain-containing protein [Ancylobacter radicis]|uniref:diguanylate cyclase n=1 Tax=Ancylobacter radicis TaxID=2836179 RepID=A0ABS5R8F1_9HYPH|nr:GGDEF domain-containing protein [Ancylobacter radicis]MBS9477953.1 GGDEF domain-containing protein [Ancylobacter radicis]
MIKIIIFVGSLAAASIGLASAVLILWLGRTAPRRIRRAWRALAVLLMAGACLKAYLSLHLFINHIETAAHDLDILSPILGLCGSLCMLAMVILTRESLGDPLKVADLRKAAFTDTLTGLPNRRSFDMAVVERVEIARRRNQPLALIMFDIDHFKAINDWHGHDAGDAVLREIGRCLRHGQRDSDMAFRMGGEEFILLLPATDLTQGTLVADRLRKQLGDVNIDKDGQRISVTTSAGVALLRPGDDAASLLQRADAALYSAKRSGRNRVCLESCPVVQLATAAQG